MTIIRSPRKERNFTVLSNTVCLDCRLSMKALGLLVRLLSRPDNWKTNSETLAREFGVGRDQVRTILSELQNFGYMSLVKTQNAQGHWESTWHVFDEANELLPGPENRVLGNPYSGESGPITRTDLPSTDNKLSVSQNSEKTVTSNAMFSTFWQSYPRKTNKSFAEKVFLRLHPTEEVFSKMLSSLVQQIPLWKDPQYIPHPSTWLNGKRWEDEIVVPYDKDRLAYERMMGRA